MIKNAYQLNENNSIKTYFSSETLLAITNNIKDTIINNGGMYALMCA